MKSPATLTPGEINRELDCLDRQQSDLVDEMIDAGRGGERWSETAKLAATGTDPLASRYIANGDRRLALHAEIEARYGPNAPSRLPAGRGFGPRNRREK